MALSNRKLMTPWLSVVFIMSVLHCVSSQTLLTSPGLTSLQSSTLNDRGSSLALDAAWVTCSSSGFEPQPWWKVDLGRTQQVTNVSLVGIPGEDLSALRIRVGDSSRQFGSRAGHEKNEICYGRPTLEESSRALIFTCSVPLNGRYVSVEPVADESATSLNLCDVKVYGTVL